MFGSFKPTQASVFLWKNWIIYCYDRSCDISPELVSHLSWSAPAALLNCFIISLHITSTVLHSTHLPIPLSIAMDSKFGLLRVSCDAIVLTFQTFNRAGLGGFETILSSYIDFPGASDYTSTTA